MSTPVLIAVGGNSLIRAGQQGTISEQLGNARSISRGVVALIRERVPVLLTHGNGPQVGAALLRSERAAGQVYEQRLDVCVASTQGEIGYLLQQSLLQELAAAALPVPVVTVLTQVVVADDDPAFRLRTKPIGPFYSRAEAEDKQRRWGWEMVEDAARGFRRVVASPEPIEIVEEQAIRRMLDQEILVIAMGGGGIPVVRQNGILRGIDAVIDKDRASVLLAMKLRHVIDSQQFTVPLLMELFDRTRQMERIVSRGGTLDYQNKIMATLFYQPSTRTRFSFEAAMFRLGGRVFSTEQARAFSSEVKGEHLEDTIRIISNHADVIVLRHSESGGAARAAAVSRAPIINAGDGGGGQHPTQALLDLYTIFRERRTLDGLTIALVGELDQGRTARSLAYLLSKFDRVKIFFVSPPELQMKPDILEALEQRDVWYALESDLQKVIASVDVVYMTQIRPGRMTDPLPRARYAIGAEVLNAMKPNAIILHPLPRTIELDKTVDDDPRAAYFQQASNGLYVRMALLTMVLEPD